MPTPAVILAAAAAVAAPALSFDDVAASARPGAAELRAAAELSAVESLLAATRGRLREAPTLGLAAGPRRADGDETIDYGAELELAPLAGRDDRDALAALAAEARRVLPAAALAESLLDLRLAYADAWAAERREALRREDFETVERWRAVAEARARAGADPPYEADLVTLEAGQARFAWIVARSERTAAWGALRALAELPAEPAPLADPPWAASPDEAASPPAGDRRPGDEGAAPGLGAEPPLGSALRRAAAVRAALGAGAAALDAAVERSRWTLRSGLEREGEERAARLGVGLRIPRPGETAAARAAVAAEAAAGRREAEVAAGRLAARFAAARALWDGLAAAPAEPALEPALAAPLVAVERRLAEGASRATEALAVRRQILAAREAALERRAARARAAAELLALTTEVTP